MSKFRYSGRANILHLNTRKEGPDEEKELALDVKVRTKTGAAICDFFEPALLPFLFLEGGAVRNPMIEPIEFAHEIRDYRLDAMGSTFYGVRLKKFSITPLDGGLVSMTFSLSFKPSGNEVARIAEYLQDEIDIALEPSTEELDFGEGDAPHSQGKASQQ